MITLVATAVRSGSGGADSATTATMDSTGADLLVVVGGHATYGGAPTVTDSKSNTWNALTSYGAGEASQNRIWWCKPTSVGSSHTFTITGTSSYATPTAYAFAGSHASPFGGESGGTDATPGPITPSEDNCVLITGVTKAGDLASIGITGTGWATPIGAVWITSNPGYASYKIQTTAGEETPTWTATDISGSPSSMAWFKAAGASQSPVPIIIQRLYR